MFVTIITDCHDNNDTGRQLTRVNSLFECPANMVGVDWDIQAAGCLIDTLDAAEGAPGVILVNIAPRGGRGKKWPNGTPFSWFWYKETLVVASIDGLCLSLIKKLRLASEIHITDLPTVVHQFAPELQVYLGQPEYIIGTQFRSFEYLPRLAKWVWDKREVPATATAITEFATASHQVWWIDGRGTVPDRFGNLKTTILPEEINFQPGKQVEINGHQVNCHARLKDVPDGEPGLIIGSSGIGARRFLELVCQGKSGSEYFGIREVGTELHLKMIE